MSKALMVAVVQVTPRIHYIFNELLGNRLGLEVSLTADQTQFAQHQGPRLSYGNIATSGVPHIEACQLLFSSGIAPTEISVQRDALGQVELYSTTNKQSALPFDLFAASFYLLTRYEEHLPHTTDQHGRYNATESVGFKHGFLHQPVVDQWTLQLRDILQAHYPRLNIQSPEYQFISTIDIDNTFAFLQKGLVRNLGGLVRDVLKGDMPQIGARLRTLTAMQSDPYATYDYLTEAHHAANASSIFFFLLGSRAKYDKNLPYTNATLRALINSIAQRSAIGIHPSYDSNSHPNLIAIEKARLEGIVAVSVVRSRQHYIMLSFPATYQRLIAAGITEDYSMGYASHLGFRAGTSIPYHHYDLAQECTTKLRIFPFCCMDGTLRHYLKLTPETANHEVNALVQQVRAVGGHFISIWHNETLRNTDAWKGWRTVFENTLKVGANG